MATMVTTAPRTRARVTYDRVFYSTMALVMALTVFVGFARTYYLKPILHTPVNPRQGPLTPLAHVHAFLFTSWVLLVIAQTTLIAQRRVSVHRRLGIAGAVLAAVMVVVGALTLLKTAARGVMPHGLTLPLFVMGPLSNVLFFGVFVVLALRMRKNREAHKRLMLLAYMCILGAAIGRIPGVLAIGPAAPIAFTFVFLLIGIVYDLLTRHSIHPAYKWGGGLLVLSVPLRFAIARTDVWKSVAERLVALVS